MIETRERSDIVRGDDGGERVMPVVEVEDHELRALGWSDKVFGTVERFEVGVEHIALTDLLAHRIDLSKLRPYLPVDLGGDPAEMRRRNMAEVSFERMMDEGIRLGTLSADVLEALTFAPSSTDEFVGNLLVNQGIQRFEDLLIGVAVQAYNNTNARIGVGNSNTAASASQTDLQAAAGAGNRQFVLMDATYPSRSSQTLTFKATHTTGLSNFPWEEWGIDNGTANGTTVTANLLNRKVTALGTKTSAAAWAFTVTVVLS